MRLLLLARFRQRDFSARISKPARGSLSFGILVLPQPYWRMPYSPSTIVRSHFRRRERSLQFAGAWWAALHGLPPPERISCRRSSWTPTASALWWVILFGSQY